MKKMFFFDIDGTLLDLKRGMLYPDAETLIAIEGLQKSGNLIAIATARQQLPPVFNQLKFDAVILSNGNYIQVGEKIIENNSFCIDDLQLLHNKTKELQGAYIMGGAEEYYTKSFSEKMQKHYKIGFEPEVRYKKESIESLVAINMVTVYLESKEAMQKFLDTKPEKWICHEYWDDALHLDVHMQGHSKGSAVLHTYEYFNIPKRDTYAFGDGINDLEMMELVGTSVAMANGKHEIKEKASIVTTAVDEKGIVNALDKIEMMNKR